MGKRILFILGTYYPIPSASGVCADRVMRTLISSGHHVCCLVNRYQDSPAYELRDGVGIYTPSLPPASTLGSRLLSALIRSKALRKPIELCWLMCRFIKSWICYPRLGNATRVQTIVQTAEDIIEREQIDTLVAIQRPVESLVAGRILKAAHPELTYIPYFLDAMAGGYIPHFRPKRLSQRSALRYEQKLLSNADRAIMLDSNQGYLCQAYSGHPLREKLVFCGIPFLQFTDTASTPRPIEFPPQKKILLYTGSVSSQRNPGFILRLLKALPREDVLVVFIGSGGLMPVLERAQIKHPEKLLVLPPMPNTALQQYLQHADILFNLGVKTPHLVSSKIFEYIALRKPIVATFAIPDESCFDYLQDYPVRLFLDERRSPAQEAERLSDFLDALPTLLQEHPIHQAELSKRYYLNTPAWVAAQIVQDK